MHHGSHRRQLWRVGARARYLLPGTPVAGEAQSCGPYGRAYGVWAVCERVLTKACSVFFLDRKAGTISSRIASIIYLSFDELE